MSSCEHTYARIPEDDAHDLVNLYLDEPLNIECAEECGATGIVYLRSNIIWHDPEPSA